MSRSNIRWPLVPVAAWAAALMIGCGSVDTYGITEGPNTAVCEDLQAALRTVKPPRPASPGICRWHAQIDELSTASVKSPKWVPFTPTEENIRDMWLVRDIYFKSADEESLNDSWRTKFERQFREVKRGDYRYEQSVFDLDNDGKEERVVREIHVGCTDDVLWPATPRMYVMGLEGIDSRYGPSGTNVSSAIFVRGKTLALVVQAVPDPEVGKSSKHEVTPRLSVVVAPPLAPSQNAPYMLDKPICSFEPNR